MMGVTGGSGLIGAAVRGPSGNLKGATGRQGPVGVTGMQGVRGRATSDANLVTRLYKPQEAGIALWDLSKLAYKAKNSELLHCPFGPACVDTNGQERWQVNGHQLDNKQIKLMKEILEDIKLAPLYINHPIMKYPAQWVLRYGNKRDLEGI